MTRRVTLVVGAADAADEALRAAVGLTLRGDAITVIVDPAADATDPEAMRARATLAAFGHTIAGPAALSGALDAEAVEVWGAWHHEDPEPVSPRTRVVLHVVRPGRRPAGVAPEDRVVHLDALDDDQLLDHVLAAGSVAVW